jgi:allantoinase
MSDSSLVIRNGSVVLPGRTAEATLVVEDETIVAILSPDAPDGPHPGAREIDATGLVVLPGAIDAHTHFIVDDPDVAEPDPEEFEGLALGGGAAAAGGVTCIVEMPHARPATTDGATFVRKKEVALRDATVDFALWGGVVPDQEPDALDDQLAGGAAALKAYTCGADPLFPGIDDARMLDALRTVAPTSAFVGVHAENDALLRAGLDAMALAGRNDPRAHAESRPPIVEYEAVQRVIALAEHAGAHVHIVHVSTPGAARLVKAAKARGARVTAETCPQYLFLDVRDLERLGGLARCAPPLRDPDDARDLWSYVADGTLDCVTSDHCAFTLESKLRGLDDIWSAPNGLPGVQTLLPLVISYGRERGLGWEDIARLTASRPAELWGLSRRKGRIDVGMDADLALVDPEREWIVSGEDLRGAHGWTPYEGRRLQSRIVQTIRRGEVVFDVDAEPQFTAAPGSGRFVAAEHTGVRQRQTGTV